MVSELAILTMTEPLVPKAPDVRIGPVPFSPIALFPVVLVLMEGTTVTLSEL